MLLDSVRNRNLNGVCPPELTPRGKNSHVYVCVYVHTGVTPHAVERRGQSHTRSKKGLFITQAVSLDGPMSKCLSYCELRFPQLTTEIISGFRILFLKSG